MTVHRAVLRIGARVIERSVARHPSETERGFVLRLLAFALAGEQAVLRAELCRGEEPAVGVAGDGGRWRRWIEVGVPKPERLDRALRKSEAVEVVVPDADEQRLERVVARAGGSLTATVLAAPLVDGLVAHLERRIAWTLTPTDDRLRVAVGTGPSAVLDGRLETVRLPR